MLPTCKCPETHKWKKKTSIWIRISFVVAMFGPSMMAAAGPPPTTTTESSDPGGENWPRFFLPQTESGCPSADFRDLTVTFGGKAVNKSNKMIHVSNNTHLHVCESSEPPGKTWPDGDYCVLPVDNTCPEGLLREPIPALLKTERSNVMYYCCKKARIKQMSSFGIWDVPFFLLPSDHRCQQMNGFKMSEEYLTVNTSRDVSNVTEWNSFVYNNTGNVDFRFCYYSKIDETSSTTSEEMPDIVDESSYRFLLPQPTGGCQPEYFSDTTLTFDGNATGYTGLKTNRTHIHMCKSKIAYKVSWPIGSYCVLPVGTKCPKELYQEPIPVFLGFGDSAVKHYCCKKDNATHPPVFKNWQMRFYLLPSSKGCQEVDSRWFFEEKLSLTTRINVSSITKWNGFIEKDGDSVILNFCRYDLKEQWIGMIAGLLGGSGGLLIFCACCYWKRKKEARLKRLLRQLNTSMSTKTSDLSLIDAASSLKDNTKPRCPLDIGATLKLILDPESQLKIYGLLIHPGKLETMDKIGKGAFGTVYQGLYKPDNNPLNVRDVAIKTLKDTCIYPEVSAFMEEAIVMADFSHVNVLGIVGVCVKPETEIPMIVLPYMEHGDLQRYCRQFRYDDKLKETPPDLCLMLSFSLHIARGMEYLSNMKFIHRDLAARNCMLGSNMLVKVADFGLARDVYSNSYYRQDKNKLLPIKWMSLESLQDRVFTSYTDVWSYGVTVWEIFTLGKVPYPDLENAEVLPKLENGVRLKKPETCPDTLYDLMLNCWHENPKARPTFANVVTAVEGVLSGFSEYLELEGKKTNPGLSSGVLCSPQELVEKARDVPTAYADYRDVKLVANVNNETW